MQTAFGLVLALLLVMPRATQAASIEKGFRRPPPAVSRCGRHVVEVGQGGISLDGEPMGLRGNGIDMVVAPTWRSDCGSVAWVELQGTERRLIVVPTIGAGAQSLSWALPPKAGDERIFWVGRSRIAVGVAMLQPRAMATWS